LSLLSLGSAPVFQSLFADSRVIPEMHAFQPSPCLGIWSSLAEASWFLTSLIITGYLLHNIHGLAVKLLPLALGFVYQKSVEMVWRSDAQS